MKTSNATQFVHDIISYILLGIFIGIGICYIAYFIFSLIQIKENVIKLEEDVKSISFSETKDNLHIIRKDIKDMNNYLERDAGNDTCSQCY